MPQADNVVTFPGDRVTTDLLRDFIASPSERLDEASARLSALEGLVYAVRQAGQEDFPPILHAALLGIEIMAGDTLRVLQLRPAP